MANPSVGEASRAVAQAERQLADAELRLASARDQLDAALACEGWTRMAGAFTPTATPLYQRADRTARLPDVLAELGALA